MTNDDEDSVVKPESSKRSVACAACGNTASPTWWKAPKGLSTDMLCSFCGIAWRKYGDLTLRSGRDESLAVQKVRTSVVEKRDGSPLTGPNAKKAKVLLSP